MTQSAEAIVRARRFAAEEISPNAEAWETAGSLPADFFERAGRAGLLGLELPGALGGAGLGFATKAAICEVLAGADFGAAMALVNSHNVAKKIADAAPSAIVAAYVPDLLSGRRIGCTALTEPHAGSDFAAIKTVARPDGEGWRLTGEKVWITNATHADVFVVYAQTKTVGDAAGIGAFLVDGRRAGFLRGRAAGAIGLHSCGAGDFRLDDHFVSGDAVIGAPGTAFKSILAEINGARIYVAAMCCGMIDSALRLVRDWGAQRTAFGRALEGHQAWRFLLAEAATDLAAARALADSAARKLEAGADVQLEAAQAKIFATRIARARIPELIHAMGAEGLKARHPLGRHLVGAQFAGLVDGATEMLLERVAKLAAKETT